MYCLGCFKDENEYTAKAAEQLKEKRRKEEEIKQEAIEKVVSGASGQVRNSEHCCCRLLKYVTEVTMV